MAPTTRKPEVEYDFDSWSDEAEQQAIAALVPDVRHIIVENRFIGRFLDGTLVELPLRLSVDDIAELEQVAPGDPIEQLRHLLTKVGGEKAAKSFTSHDIAETMILASKFFDIIQRIAGAPPPHRAHPAREVRRRALGPGRRSHVG